MHAAQCSHTWPKPQQPQSKNYICNSMNIHTQRDTQKTWMQKMDEWWDMQNVFQLRLFRLARTFESEQSPNTKRERCSGALFLLKCLREKQSTCSVSCHSATYKQFSPVFLKLVMLKEMDSLQPHWQPKVLLLDPAETYSGLSHLSVYPVPELFLIVPALCKLYWDCVVLNSLWDWKGISM